MGRTLLIGSLCLLFPWLCLGRTPLTHETMWRMKRVASPVVSPDGKLVVFSVTEPAYDEKDQQADLWLAPVDGAWQPRRLTASRSPETGAAWSPDSARLAFSAKREGDEKPQIYILDIVRGGEAVRATSLSTGASSPRWSPDGKWLLFSSIVYPGAADDAANQKLAAEQKGRKYSLRAYDGFPIRYWDHWLDDMQIHLFVQAVEGPSTARDLLAGSNLVNQPGFGGVLSVTSEALPATWTPDGQAVVFTATTNRNQAAYASVHSNLYQVAAGGGEPRLLVGGRGDYDDPRFSADGKSLYCSFRDETGKAYALARILRFAWPAVGKPVVVTAGLDRSASAFALSADSQTLFLLTEEAGRERLYMLPAAGGAARQPVPLEEGSFGAMSASEGQGGTVLTATWQSATHPPEVVVLDVATGKYRLLTGFSTGQAAEVDWQPLREFEFTSSRGKRIHSFLALPPAFDPNRKYPLLVLMHGGPASMWRDEFILRWNYHLLASPGYVVLLTDYTGSTGYGEKFAQEIQGDPLQGPAGEINEAATEAGKRFSFIDGARSCAAGASYGGHLANWMQATTNRYRCLISHAGLINLESQWATSDTIFHREVNAGGPVWEQGPVWKEQNPIRYARNFRTPILLSVGENDFRVPLNQTLENWSVLKRLQIPSRLLVWPQANHWILRGEDSRKFYQEMFGWLGKYLN
ncbi:MAG: S9 family peptidase [Acidobacteria bacterium]|nr:S9 family peptidase [Acidobacteriota bacterium]